VLLYIHGFNTSLNHAIRRAAQLTNDLKFKGVVLAYCWPSKGRFWRYSKDAVAVDKTANNLRQVITTLLTEKVQGISQVHILAHSMGTRALINALKDQGQTKAKETKGKGERLRNVILAAADAQRCKFEAMLQVMYPEDAKGKVPQRPIISVYSSAHDSALRISKWLNWEIRLGDTYSLLEMKKWENKVDVVDATGERCAGSRHSYHAEVQDVLNDIQELLTNSRRAKESEVRRSIIKEVASKDKLTFHAFDEDWWTRERLTQGPWMVRW
jgi:esterase/lipase superfamily enzyme